MKNPHRLLTPPPGHWQCPACLGSGFIGVWIVPGQPDELDLCDDCGGSGWVAKPQDEPQGLSDEAG